MGHRFVDGIFIRQRMEAKDRRIARQLHGSLVKPLRGSALIERKERRADAVAAEQKEMQAALKRDQHKCRWPGCSGKHRGLTLPIDAAHQRHRGLGGDPSGERTTRQTVLALCRRCHGLWDACLTDIRPLTGDGFDGPVAFYTQDMESGLMVHIASETTIGVSEPRRA